MLRKINIKKEEKQLYAAFDDCLQHVKGKTFYEGFAREKIKHSMQVVGAGNYILKNEKKFKNRSEAYLKLGKLVNLFHDIGRFKEIELLSKAPASKHDHGYYSYEILKELGYDDLRLLLPVKQHGNLAEALEEDIEFQKIEDAQLKKEVEELYGLVKDADKIANLYLIKYDGRIFKDLFFAGLTEEAKFAPISPNVLSSLEHKALVKKSDCVSFSDRLVQILCFAFEIYNRSSFEFILRHNLFENLFDELDVYCPDKEQGAFIRTYVTTYVHDKYANMAA